MSRLRLASLAMLLLATFPYAANAGCKDDWICVYEVMKDSDIELRARNLREYPITYTLSVDTSHYSIAGSKTVTRTLGPGESALAIFLDGHQGSGKDLYSYRYKWTVGRHDAKHDDDYVYALPYAAYRSYRVLQGYGSRFSHIGREEFAVDFDMRVGTPVHAARPGVVARIEESNSEGCWRDDCGQYANYIVILHTDGTTGEYYHLDNNGVTVDVGDSIKRGQQIGFSGNTGHTTMPHLHFAVYRAVAWGRTQSIAVRFQSADGIINQPRRGARYQARQAGNP
jgi:murein DD-endopeptidase MepM/ murein hydrolase activator NlpD